MKTLRLLASCAVLLLQLTNLLVAQEKVTEFANDIQLVGTLGDGIKIEMQLQRDGNQPFWTLAQGECADVKGKYYYRSQVRPITLKGRICLANHTMELSSPDYAEVNWEERFVGKWDAKLGTFSGEWTLKKTNKTLPFVVKDLALEVPEPHKQAFFDLLDQQMSTDPSEEWFSLQYRIEDFQWQGGSGRAVNTEAVEVWHFSPLRFECYHNWSNAGNGNDQVETLQMLPLSVGLFALQSYESRYSSPAGESDDGELLFDEGCESILRLWEWKNSTWTDITAQYLPEMLKTALQANLPEHECEIEMIQDAVRVGKIKRYWVNENWVEK